MGKTVENRLTVYQVHQMFITFSTCQEEKQIKKKMKTIRKRNKTKKSMLIILIANRSESQSETSRLLLIDTIKRKIFDPVLQDRFRFLYERLVPRGLVIICQDLLLYVFSFHSLLI